MNRSLSIALTLLALLATGCPKDDSSAADAAFVPPDARVQPPDAAQPEPPDAALPGPDAGPVIPPLRTLLTPHLMGEASLKNLVIAPNFDPGSEQWIPIMGNGYAQSYLQTLARTPADGLPVLKLLNQDLGDRYIMGTIRGGKAPLLASVWVGRDEAAPTDLTVDFSVQGLTPTSTTDQSFSLVAEAGTEQTIDKIRWVRYSAQIDEDLLGFATMVGYDAAAHHVYFQAPSLVELGDTRLHVNAPVAVKRRPTAGEAKAVHLALETMRRRPPPQRIRP